MSEIFHNISVLNHYLAGLCSRFPSLALIHRTALYLVRFSTRQETRLTNTQRLEQMGTVQAFLCGQPTDFRPAWHLFICYRGNYPYNSYSSISFTRLQESIFIFGKKLLIKILVDSFAVLGGLVLLIAGIATLRRSVGRWLVRV